MMPAYVPPDKRSARAEINKLLPKYLRRRKIKKIKRGKSGPRDQKQDWYLGMNLYGY